MVLVALRTAPNKIEITNQIKLRTMSELKYGYYWIQHNDDKPIICEYTFLGWLIMGQDEFPYLDDSFKVISKVSECKQLETTATALSHGVVFSEAEVCQLKQAEYERGIEDGKIIAKHGTVNWQT